MKGGRLFNYFKGSLSFVILILAIGDRVLSNDFTSVWHGRDEEIVAHREELRKKLLIAKDSEDAKIAKVQVGCATGLISSVEPAAEIVRRIIEEADAILRGRPQTLLKDMEKLGLS